MQLKEAETWKNEIEILKDLLGKITKHAWREENELLPLTK